MVSRTCGGILMTIKVSKPAINLREKLNELEQDTGLKGQELMRAETVAEARSLIGAGRRNLIINGGFDVWQRGTSFTPSTAGGDYTADRWIVYYSSSSATTVTKRTDASDVPFSNYLRIDNTIDADSGWIELNQYVEDYSHLINNTVTVSFWAKASYAIQDAYVYTNAGITSSGFGLTTSWAKYKVTLELKAGTVAANGYLRVLLGTLTTVNADSYIDFAQVQLEEGKLATEFEHRSYGEELALCQRYYYKIKCLSGDDGWFTSGFSYATTACHGIVTFPVTMRVAPSLEHSNTATDYKVWHSANVNSVCNSVPSSDGETLTTARLAFGVASGLTVAAPCLFRAATINSFIAFKAEL